MVRSNGWYPNELFERMERALKQDRECYILCTSNGVFSIVPSWSRLVSFHTNLLPNMKGPYKIERTSFQRHMLTRYRQHTQIISIQSASIKILRLWTQTEYSQACMSATNSLKESSHCSFLSPIETTPYFFGGNCKGVEHLDFRQDGCFIAPATPRFSKITSSRCKQWM